MTLTRMQWAKRSTRNCPNHGNSLSDIPRSMVKWTFWCVAGQHIWRYRCDPGPKKARPHWYPVRDNEKPTGGPRG